jgi:hypothetical protein
LIVGLVFMAAGTALVAALVFNVTRGNIVVALSTSTAFLTAVVIAIVRLRSR